MQRPESPNLNKKESTDELRAHELIKLYRKLRWIGDDDQAKEIAKKLRLLRSGDCVVALPSDTD